MSTLSKSHHRNQFYRKPLAIAVALSAMGSGPAVLAQDEQMALEEVVVTARKRSESLQDVPISIQALSSTKLDELGINGFDDYAAMLPTVSFTGIGPGTNRIFMRGAADGGDGNVSGSQPSVGVYLDEQPVTAIGANLDIHIYDIERIEALAGPQGTLYGASSQSGTLRIITNKADPSAFAAGFDAHYAGIDGGDTDHGLEGFVNMPLGERTAIRLVGWSTQEGGWIENIPGTRTFSGLQPGDRSKTIDNERWVKDDQNEVETKGARAALRVDLTENWVGTASVIYQEQQSDGAFDQDRALDENEIQRYYDDWQDDEFTQYALTLEGEFLNQGIIYAGSYMDRDLDYYADYTAYGEVTSYVPYYGCNYYTTDESDFCTSAEEYLYFDNNYERTSHELRLQSLGDGPFHYTAGAYYEDAEHKYDQQFTQPFMSPSLWTRGRENIYFNTDQKRTDELWAVFGELTYDITDSLRATVGARHYDSTNKLEGYTGWGETSFGNKGFDVDSKTDDDDQIYKFNVTWDVTDDAMVYATYSEGYRVGGLNRDPNVEPSTYAPDKLNNYELGWKTTWLEGRLRFNGAAYYSEWDDMQFTIYEFALSPVGNTYNVGEAEIKGAELDFSYLMFNSLTLSGAMAYNDAETTEDFTLNSRVSGDIDFNAPDGSDLPFVPELKYSLNARYEFNVASLDSYTQLTYTYTDESYNDIRPARRDQQDEFSNLNLRAGFNTGSWGVEVYATNLTDENDDVFIGNRSYYDTAAPQKPRTVGVRFSMRFD